MPRASASAAAETARVVRAVAGDLFAARGVAEVSLDDIARAAGVTRGAVYHHYGSKAGVVRAVVARLQEQVADAVVAAAVGEDAGERLRKGSHAFLDAITDAPVRRVLLVDGPAVIGWDAWRDLDAAASEAHLRDALVDAGVAQDMVDAAAVQLSGAMNEAALWIARSAEPAARDRAVKVLDALLDAVLAM